MASVRQLLFHLLYLDLLFDMWLYWYFVFVFVFAACICIIVSQCIVAGGGRGRNLSEWPVSAANQEEETHSLTSSVNTLSNTQHTTHNN